MWGICIIFNSSKYQQYFDSYTVKSKRLKFSFLKNEIHCYLQIFVGHSSHHLCRKGSNCCILVSIELFELLDQNKAQKRKTNRYISEFDVLTEGFPRTCQSFKSVVARAQKAQRTEGWQLQHSK